MIAFSNEDIESNVRFYSRLFPDIFSKAKGSYVFNRSGEKYLDFFSGSGSLNYGHNDEGMQNELIRYIKKDGIVNSLDQMTEAKFNFMSSFKENILQPRNFDYKMQFCGPTGTNCIEAALKLARKATQRETVVYFNNSFHGMTYGSMSISGIRKTNIHDYYDKHTFPVPYADDELDFKTLKYYLSKRPSHMLPAAVVLETIQAEGGINVAPREWLESLNDIVKKFDILLIIDDIQTGSGRTGPFFSFEGINVKPDIICLSKSLSGIGLPLAMNLVSSEIDCWNPGEHSGTFRGNNFAFVTATHASKYWNTKEFQMSIDRKACVVDKYLGFLNEFAQCSLKGRGLMKGLALSDSTQATEMQRRLFRSKILADVCGKRKNVLKIMPPLNIDTEDLISGLERIRELVEDVIKK